MTRCILFLLILITCSFSSSNRNGEQNPSYHLRFMEKEGVKVGLLPEVGGRVVYFGTERGGNLFNQDTKLKN